VADYYEAVFVEAGLVDSGHDAVRRMLGPGPGRLLDVGCGTGWLASRLARAGWDVTGVDVSEDQLRLARDRGVRVVRADAAELPFGDGSFYAAVSTWTHTDADDFPGLLREVVRVVVPGGAFCYVGVHPCFVGPHAFVYGREVPELHPCYRDTARRTEAPGIRRDGLRAKVGATHLPLGEFLQAFLDAGLVIERVEEPGDAAFPHSLALGLRVPIP
jgi:ubiquinone/menaquinone biosynthesis C-methylase UbiE